ncbi:MAG: hypothetical protein EKK46_00455 [Rhodocyclaceae bacterium]|nr:MAG: hypothetical protein EKK46_00455 [Rhodocyclaceae bacterium]
MKATDLEKNRGLKITGQMRNAGIPSRFAQDAAALPDKKEQRRRDQALGLVPFAVKINQELVTTLQRQAVAQNVSLNELVETLLRKGLASA